MRVYEWGMPRPRSFDPSSTFVKRMLGQVVGFRIPVEKVEGKRKLNQNQPLERQEGRGELKQRGGENADL
jgi:transcriptional regulator